MGIKLRTFIAVLVLINLLILPSISGAENNDVSYINGGNIDDDLTINEGEVVIITNTVTIKDGVKIQVHDGGVLNLSGSLKGTSFGSTILPYAINSTIMIPNTVSTGTKVVEITVSLESEEEYGPSIFWNGNWENITNKSEHTISVPFSSGDEPLLINILGNNIFGTVITSITLSIDDSEVFSDTPWNFEQEGLKPYNSRNWDLINDGEMNLENSEIIGAKVSGSGTFNSINSHYNLSSPILLNSSSEFNIEGGGMDGSETDEYIEGPWGMEINWTNADSTGDADRWIKTLKCQKIVFPDANINFIIKNISWYGTNKPIMDSTNENGEYEIMCDSNFRMVEIVNSLGESQVENAYIESAWWNSPWGNFSTNNIPLNFNPTMEVELDLPEVNIISIDLNKNISNVDEPIEITLTLENSGNSPAIVPIECKLSDGSDADITPFGQTVLIDAGETGVALIDWRNSKDGEESITCKTLKPSGFENSALLGEGSITSNLVTWNALLDPSDTTSSTIIVLLVLFGGVIGLITYLNKTSTTKEYNKNEKTDPVKED
ncbi:MAG: hypothetical protein CMB64_05430 [Euryarchaeota archaeon]|nr:hypothetical protein [Euryarchaeota archaeon]